MSHLLIIATCITRRLILAIYIYIFHIAMLQDLLTWYVILVIMSK